MVDSARLRHCRNPPLYPEMGPRKMRLQAYMYNTDNIPGLKIATNVVTSATSISSLATKNSGLVSTMATIVLC